MKQMDLAYLCGTIGSLCGFPVRLYQGEELVLMIDHSGLHYDPMGNAGTSAAQKLGLGLGVAIFGWAIAAAGPREPAVSSVMPA